MNVHVEKTVPVTYQMVVAAYARVKSGGKAVGVDGESWKTFEAKGVEKQLYVVWNRMASGSYFPQAVREVEIPKKDGKVRKLGIPTIRDRIAQEVVRKYIEQRVDAKFHAHSYGYRPLKSAKQATDQVRLNCLQQDWVLDMDISKFFDEIDHELMLKAVEHMIADRWVRVYVQRWLEMRIIRQDGTEVARGGKGTPQGGVISPLLANLFLHFTLDKWLEKHYAQVKFVRYADDVIVHCQTELEAQQLRSAIQERLQAVGLRLNEQKTKIVYCKDYKRKQPQSQVQFDFLGFSYQPRPTPSQFEPGRKFMVFVPEISKTNQKKIRDEIKGAVNWRNTMQRLEQIADKLNNKLRGWMNYFGMYGKRQLHKTLRYVDSKVLLWLSCKHKQGVRQSIRQLRVIRERQPTLFYHWHPRTKYRNMMTRAV
jgi:group II intron reverse transcriptase/maturase